MSTAHKFLTMLEAIGLFVVVVGLVLAAANRVSGRRGDRIVAAALLLPTLTLVGVGLVDPAVQTLYQSFFDRAGTKVIGLDNYHTIFTDPDQLDVLRNTVLWVVLTPFLATGIGLVYAILVDKARIDLRRRHPGTARPGTAPAGAAGARLPGPPSGG